MAINKISIGEFDMWAGGIDHRNDDVAQLGEGAVYRGHLIKELVGFDSAQRRVSGFNKPQAHGYQKTAQWFGAREVEIFVQVFGDTQASYDESISLLKDETSLYVETQTMIIENDSGRQYRIEGVTKELEQVEQYPIRNVGVWRIKFLSETVNFLDLGPNGLGEELILNLEDSESGIRFPITFPITFKVPNFAANTATNDGNNEAFPMIRFTGPLEFPYITNTTYDPDKTLRLITNIDAGDYIDVDMLEQRIYNSDGDELFNVLSPDLRDFWSLQPGDNILSFGHAGQINDEATCRVAWFNPVNHI